MAETHDCKNRASVWRLFFSTPLCPDCKTRIELWLPLRTLSGLLACLVLVFAVVTSVRLRSYWPYAFALPVIFGIELATLRYGRIVLVPPGRMVERRIAWALFVLLALGLFIYMRFFEAGI